MRSGSDGMELANYFSQLDKKHILNKFTSFSAYNNFVEVEKIRKYLIMSRNPSTQLGQILFPPAHTISEFIENRNTMRALQKVTNLCFFMPKDVEVNKAQTLLNNFFDQYALLNPESFPWTDVLKSLEQGADVNVRGNITTAAKENAKLHRHNVTFAHVLAYCVKNRVGLPDRLIEKLLAFGLDLTVLKKSKGEEFTVAMLFDASDYAGALSLIRYGEDYYISTIKKMFGKKITFLDAIFNILKKRAITSEDALLVKDILACNVPITDGMEKNSRQASVLLSCLDLLPSDLQLTSEMLQHLKLFKEQLLAAMAELGPAEEYRLLKKIFKEKNTPLSQVFYAGTPNIHDKNSRTGKAHTRFHELEAKQLKVVEKVSYDDFVSVFIRHRYNSNDIAIIDCFLKENKHPNTFDINKKIGNLTKFGNLTALMIAANDNNVNTVKKLLDAGADPRALSDVVSDADPQVSAWPNAVAGRLKIAECFIAHDPSLVNYQNINGGTALMHAAYHEKIDVLCYLLTLDNIDIKASHAGKTALDYAIDKQFLEGIVHLLVALKSEDISDLQLSSIMKLYSRRSFFNCIKSMSIDDQLNAYIQILRDRETTAIGKLFWFGKTELKGILAEIYFQSNDSLKEKIKLMPEILSADDIEKIRLFTGNREVYVLVPIRYDYEIAPILFNYVNQISADQLGDHAIFYLKEFKTPFQEIINNMPDQEEAFRILSNIFDETKPDKRNDKTAIAKVFWAGHPVLTEGRLGAAWKKYLELKEKRKEKKAESSGVSFGVFKPKPDEQSQLFSKPDLGKEDEGSAFNIFNDF